MGTCSKRRLRRDYVSPFPGLHSCSEPGRQGRQEPRGRFLEGRTGGSFAAIARPKGVVRNLYDGSMDHEKMMKRALPAVLVCFMIARCGSGTGSNKLDTEQKVFSTPDFALLVPSGWKLLEDGSSPDRVIFQAGDGSAQLTLSVMAFDPSTPSDSLGESFVRLVEHRRQAELAEQPAPELTQAELKQGEGYWFAKWFGKIKATDQCSATLVTIENKRFFTLFIERQGIDAQAIGDLAQEIFTDFKAKEDSNESMQAAPNGAPDG